MSKVDDELTRRLHRAERPVDGEGLFGGLARRRSHREHVRRVQAGLLAFTVLAATAGGFVVLQQAFDTDKRNVGDRQTPSVRNGEIVFSREGADGRSHLYAAQPDGSQLRQITRDATNDTDPAVSPDGGTIAYVRASDEHPLSIATVPLQGGDVVKLADGYFVDDPAWSPDGTEVAYVFSGVDSILLGILNRNGQLSRSLLDVVTSIASPSWSPDGSRIAISVVPQGSRGSVGIIPSHAMTQNPLEATLGVGQAPAWSPDGTSVALIRAGDEGDEIWSVAPDGTHEELLAIAVGSSLEPDLTWAPDGTSLLVSDGERIYRVDATPSGDPRENFVQLVHGHSPAWQPVEVVSGPSPSPSPTPSTSPEPELAGRDIGVGFHLCSIERLGGVEWFGDGTEGTAWTGTRVDDRGRCGRESTDSVIAGDLDGDGTADTWTGIDGCTQCAPWGATDLDGNGTEELVVMLFADLQPTFAFYFAVPDGLPRSSGIYRIFLEGPGLSEVGLGPEGSVAVQAGGGEEGLSANAIRCEGYPEDPVLVVARWIKDESTGAIGYFGARLKLDTADDLVDAHFVMVDTFTPTASSEDFGGDGDACGVDFNPWN
jgi:hypothetical protein